jgi:general secretion pathway protein K
VNTAPKAVLLALSPSLNGSNVESWIADRVKNPVQSADDFFKTAQVQPDPNATGVAQVATSYLELRAEVLVGSNRVALYSVIYKQGGTSVPVVIAHSTDSD